MEKSNAVQLAEDVLGAVKHFKGALTADGCRQAVGKSYFSHSGLDSGGYQCSPRGVKLAPKGEEFMDFTWAKFIKFCKENGLIEEESIKCNHKPAPKPAAAATMAAPAVMPTAETSTTSESAADAAASTLKPSSPDAPTPLSAPASPAEAGAVTHSLSAAAPASLEAPAAFDYTGLDRPTADALHWAEREICDARRDYVARLAQAVYIAHDALCGGVVAICDNSKHGHRGEDTFRTWCASVGLGKDTAYRLLQVAALLNGSTPEEQAVLEAASPSLLYAAAKPSAPAQLVQGVKDGDITTHKQYQDLLARLRDKEQELASVRQEAALDRKEQEDANAAALRYKAEADRRAQDQQRLEGRIKSLEAQAREAERNLAGAREALTAAKARGDRWKEKAEALEAQAAAPAIEAKVIDPEEVERLAAEKAEALAARQNAQRAAEDARAAYDAVILAGRSIDAAWQALAPMLPRLAQEEKRQAIHQFVNKLICIKEDALKCL